MASTPGFEPGQRWWKANALNATPPLLFKEQEEFTSQCSWIASIRLDQTKYQTPVYHGVQQLN